jgi:hypothetical protein
MAEQTITITITITITETVVDQKQFTLAEVEEAAGLTLAEADDVDELVAQLRERGTLTDTIERECEVTERDWYGSVSA